MRKIFFLVFLLICGGTEAKEPVRMSVVGNEIKNLITLDMIIEKMNGLVPDNLNYNKGVSAMYAGICEGQMLVGGGCNFPDVPVAEGGKKKFYSEIYVSPLDKGTTLEWKLAGHLPEASAYGVTVATEQGLVCVGGCSAEGNLSRVLLLTLSNGKIETKELPSLPFTMDNMAGAFLNDCVYVVGGNVNGLPSSDMYSLSMESLETGWQKETSIPGNPRVQPVCVAQSGKLYLWGGFAVSANHPATISIDGYSYNPSIKEWTPIATPVDASGESVLLGGGVGVALSSGQILCTGGVNKVIFLEALQGIHKGKEYLSHSVDWYRFNGHFLLYNPLSDSWTDAGCYPQGARAGAVMLSDGNDSYIIGGELKPGIRSNEINRIR